MKNKIMHLLIPVYAAAIFLCISSCGTKSEKGDNLTFMAWGDVYNKEFFDSLARQYNKTNPKVKVEIFSVTRTQYYQKLVTMAAGNSLCDVTMAAHTEYDLLAFKDQLMPLDDFINGPEFKDILPHIMPNTLTDGRRHGVLYGIPIWTWTQNLYYNKTLLQKFGVGELSGKWNWNDFLNVCRKITRRDNIMERTFGVQPLTRGYGPFHEMLLKQNNLSMYSMDMQRCIINSKSHFPVFQYLFDLTLKHKVMVSESDMESTASAGSTGQGGVFGSGMVGFNVGGRELAGMLVKANLPFTWDVVKMPTDTKDAFVALNCYIGIAKNSQKKEAALAFLKWMASEQGQRLVTLRRMDIAVYKPLLYSPQFENMLGMPKLNLLYRDCIENTVAADPRFPSIQEFYDKIKIEFELVNDGKRELRHALNQIAAEYDTLKE